MLLVHDRPVSLCCAESSLQEVVFPRVQQCDGRIRLRLEECYTFA